MIVSLFIILFLFF